MKWPFRRKAQDQTTVPLEVQEYYQTERRERTGVAWLLAIGTLVVTLLLAALLFFGGRWIYRALTNNDEQTETTSQVDTNTTTDSSTTTDTNQPAASDTQSNATTGISSTSTDQPSQATTPSSTTATTPTTTGTSTGTTAGASTEGLPNTGPGEVVGAVIAITVSGALTHYALVGRRYQS